jgi:hypothetical protein
MRRITTIHSATPHDTNAVVPVGKVVKWLVTVSQDKLVPLDALYGPPFIQDQWNETFSKEPEKEDINHKFKQYLIRYHRPCRRVVVLDSPSTGTTNVLSTFLKKHQIHVPNPNPTFLDEATPDFRDKATHSCETLHQWAITLNDAKRYDVAGDYCCTYTGNDGVNPMHDLDTLFSRKIIAEHNGVLWFTFATRGQGVTHTLTEVPQEIEFLATLHGYRVKLLEANSYTGGGGSSMVYFFLVTVGNKKHNRKRQRPRRTPPPQRVNVEDDINAHKIHRTRERARKQRRLLLQQNDKLHPLEID